MKKMMLLCVAMVALAAMTACKSGTREKAVTEPPFPIELMDDNHRVVAKIPGSMMDLSGLNSDILLGTDFFRHFNVIFDYKNNMLYLKHN